VKKIKLISAILVGMAFLCNHLKAQDYLGGWYLTNAKFVLSEKWSAWTEVQTRAWRITDRFYYHELKGGFSYQINPSANALMGFGQYGTYDNTENFKSPVTHEFRMWEQMTLTNNIGRLKLEHRYRIEQRFFGENYRNRFRYRLNGLIPLNHKTISNGTFYLSVYDEIFLNNRAPHFERNRIFGGAGYQFNKVATFQAGYLNQYDYRNPTHFSKEYLQAALLLTFDAKSWLKDRHPSSDD
jgi:hypothetical protein